VRCFGNKADDEQGSGGFFSGILKKVQESGASTPEADAKLKKQAEALEKTAATLKQKTQEGFGVFRDVASKASTVIGDSAKKAAEASSKAAGGVTESEFMKAAKPRYSEFKKQAQATASSFHQQTDGEKQKETPNASKDARPDTPLGKVRGAFGWMVDAYKEEYRLARMTETELEEEKSRARRIKAEEDLARAEAEALERGEDWAPSEETAIMVQKAKQTAWEKRWGWFQEKTKNTEAYGRFQKLQASPFVLRSKEAVEDMRERWETSESPVVQRLQTMHESLTRESETAVAMKEIRARDPHFSMQRFMSRMKDQVPPILSNYLKGDLEKLKELRVGDELLERMGGQVRAWKAEASVVDHNILDISEMELVEVKMFGENPIIILRCVCQQINCVRDKFDNVVEGAPDDIQSVHYGWAMEQNPMGSGEHGGPPEWIVREMMVQGMQAIV
jgi:import inner membrane translocase subunit TIM44